MSRTADKPQSLLETLRQLREAPNRPAGEFVLTGSAVKVHLRRWSVGERLKVVALFGDKQRPAVEKHNEILSLALCDELNNRLFATVEDFVAFDLPLGADADKIVDAALTANGFGGGDEKKANSTATPTN